jgi:coiled-coil domain-containing protein 39
MELVHT